CMESLEPKTPSWTENDLLVLITEYWKRKDILRAKASESVTNLQKRECWIEITEVVNARCFTPHTKKTMDQLKRKWEKTIMLAKKAALNIQKRSGNLSDLAPAYQLALSIVCEDFPASLECANGLAAADVPSLAEHPNAGGYIDEVSSMVITELEEESSGDGPPLPKGDKAQPLKADVLGEAAEGAPHPLGSRGYPALSAGSEDGAADGHHPQQHEAHDASAAEFVNNFRKRKWEQDLIELQKEKVRRQIQYHKVQHELQMSVLRSQMEFWEMKKSKLAAEIRQGGIPTSPPSEDANASAT
ncbi:hypothetical protein V5799_006157, partial [Amblyomma americanum]